MIIPSRYRWPVAIAIGAMSMIPFLRATRAEFLNWDDDVVLLANMQNLGFGSAQIKWMFTTSSAGHYQPLTWLSYTVDRAVWGMNPTGYHLTNIVLHGMATALVYLLARELFGIAGRVTTENDLKKCAWAAGAAALFFGVHPLRVESVAWVTERRDMLSLVLLLAAVLAYVNYAAEQTGARRGASYVAALGFTLGSLLAKPWGMTLPIVLLVLDVFPLNRWRAVPESRSRRALFLIVEKVPFVVLSGAAAYLSLLAQGAAQFEPTELHPLPARLAQACYGLVFYVSRTFYPVGLSPLYELPVKINPWEARYVGSAIVVVLISVAAFVMRRRNPSIWTSWAIFVIVVSPVLGLTQIGPQLVADRYSYVACIPFAILMGSILLIPTTMSRAVRVGVAVMLVMLSTLTWRQTGYWKTSETLWARCLLIEPDSVVGHKNLGALLAGKGDMDGAASHFEWALKVRPNDPIALGNMAAVLAGKGQTAEALNLYHRALEHKIPNVGFLLNTAEGLLKLNRPEEAYPIFTEVAKSQVGEIRALVGQAMAAERSGRTQDAIRHYDEAILLIGARLEAAPLFSPDREVLGGQYTALCGKIANLLEQIGDHKRAAHYLEKL